MIDPDGVTAVGVILALAFIIKMLLDHRLKSRLIDKGLVDEKVKYLYDNTVKGSILNNLKWGLVLCAIGIAALASWWFPGFIEEEGILGMMFLLAGIALLIYYFIAPKLIDSNRDDSQPRVP